jgi:hypothetical protein
MWVYFETFHVIQPRTYMSNYSPAKDAFLALGQILGHPWIRVLLSVVAMCTAIVWALQGWFPPQWALLGGVLVLLRFLFLVIGSTAIGPERCPRSVSSGDWSLAELKAFASGPLRTALRWPKPFG